MNYTPILEKCPTAFQAFLDFENLKITEHKTQDEVHTSLYYETLAFDNDGNSTDVKMGYSERSLYDFFDFNKVYGFVVPNTDGYLYFNVNGTFYMGEKFTDRLNAEEALYSKMFELLENKLTTEPRVRTKNKKK